MNIEKLKDVVGTIEYLKKMTDAPDSALLKMLVEYLYDETNGEVFSYFLLIDGIRKERLKEERNLIMHGLEDAMHAMSHLSGKIDEKDWKSLATLNKIYFDPTDGNIAFLIHIARAYFPDGTYGHASQSGVEFFNKFRRVLRMNKDKYLTGDSMEWAKMMGHYDYMKLVLEKDPDNPPDILYRADGCPFYLQKNGQYTAQDEHGVVILDPKLGSRTRPNNTSK